MPRRTNGAQGDRERTRPPALARPLHLKCAYGNEPLLGYPLIEDDALRLYRDPMIMLQVTRRDHA